MSCGRPVVLGRSIKTRKCLQRSHLWHKFGLDVPLFMFFGNGDVSWCKYAVKCTTFIPTPNMNNYIILHGVRTSQSAVDKNLTNPQIGSKVFRTHFVFDE